jgi:hypothetical protein
VTPASAAATAAWTAARSRSSTPAHQRWNAAALPGTPAALMPSAMNAPSRNQQNPYGAKVTAAGNAPEGCWDLLMSSTDRSARQRQGAGSAAPALEAAGPVGVPAA